MKADEIRAELRELGEEQQASELQARRRMQRRNLLWLKGTQAGLTQVEMAELSLVRPVAVGAALRRMRTGGR